MFISDEGEFIGCLHKRGATLEEKTTQAAAMDYCLTEYGNTAHLVEFHDQEMEFWFMGHLRYNIN